MIATVTTRSGISEKAYAAAARGSTAETNFAGLFAASLALVNRGCPVQGVNR
ncbi:hypothetical protein [Microbispora bryophytorum]|uniref:hypothetical protein n=1 Tax=Microbispora bryophytorum TaxID=1460882 RepID=UPI00371FB1C9